MILLLDNFDSFTFNLVDYFEQLNVEVHVVRNNVPLEEIKKNQIAGLVISPGPEIPKKAGCLMQVLAYYANKIPILGICLGHQAIGQYYGMQLKKAPVPRHGKITKIKHYNDVIFSQIPNEFGAVQYNSLILEESSKAQINIIATGIDKQIMAIKHKNLPIWGLQYHPEAALTEYGLLSLKNWVDYNKLGI